MANRFFTDSQVDEEPVLAWFDFSHLPPHLQLVSAEFAGLAKTIVSFTGPSEERTVALRKLLESKDAAVRASLPPRA